MTYVVVVHVRLYLIYFKTESDNFVLCPDLFVNGMIVTIETGSCFLLPITVDRFMFL